MTTVFLSMSGGVIYDYVKMIREGLRMEQGTQFAQAIVNFGAGIVALVVLFGVVIWLARKIPPYLKAMSEQSTLANEVIRTNSQFMGEMAKSNQNMAKALEMMAPVFERNISLLEEHDKRSQVILNELLRLAERTDTIHRRMQGNGRID